MRPYKFIIYHFNNNPTKFTILSLSFGSLIAINKVIAVKASGVILSLNLNPTLFKNQIKENAPLLLFPSKNGWSLIIKYNK